MLAQMKRYQAVRSRPQDCSSRKKSAGAKSSTFILIDTAKLKIAQPMRHFWRAKRYTAMKSSIIAMPSLNRRSM